MVKAVGAADFIYRIQYTVVKQSDPSSNNKLLSALLRRGSGQ